MPTWDNIRKRGEPARDILGFIWDYWCEKRDWPTIRIVHGKFAKSRVVSEFRRLGTPYVIESEAPFGRIYRLHIIGMLCAPHGDTLYRLLNSFFRFLRDVSENPCHTKIDSTDVQHHLKLTDVETAELGAVLQVANERGFLHMDGSLEPSGNWSFTAPTEIDDLAEMEDLTSSLDGQIAKTFEPNIPVLLDDRVAAASSAFDHLASLASTEPVISDPAASGDRRYQVFVSSTYEDLKLERSKVMQALLMSKCIPAGMELFPAAGETQWDLIKRVIDECDYYIVVLGSRYGSTRSVRGKKVSYTELEFNYAVRKKKVILAFPRRDLLQSNGSTPEPKNAKDCLNRFVRKIMRYRMCREWSTPEQLESEVKTAIAHAIERHPKPGWVRVLSTWKTGKTPVITLPPAAKEVEIKRAEERPETGGCNVKFSDGQTEAGVAAVVRLLVRGNGEAAEMAVQTGIHESYIMTHRFIDVAVKEALVARKQVEGLQGITLTALGRRFAIARAID
jgi:Domain of unknown function (DUF4062)